MSGPFAFGETALFEATFKSEASGDAIDPSPVTLTLFPPTGASFTVATTKIAVGQYQAVATLSVAGAWKAQWSGTVSTGGFGGTAKHKPTRFSVEAALV
jgi:hypothetical protein